MSIQARMPEVFQGPPLRGAPWAQHVFVEPIRAVVSPAPTVSNRQVAGREVLFGPPLRGAPWAQRLFVEPVVYRAPPGPQPTPGPVVAKGLPLLERVPDVTGPGGPDRLRRHTEKLSIIINSLVSQGILVQTGPASWTIAASALSGAEGAGLTGTFTAPGDYHV